MTCTFPNCKSNAVHSTYCIGHAKLMGVEKPRKEVKPIPKTSESEKERQRRYKKVRKAFLIAHPKCEVKGCNKVSMEVHHKKGRIGDLLIDTSTFMAVCDEHHRLIEDNPQWAKEQGYSEGRLTKI